MSEKPPHKRNNKRKKNFLKNAKKYAKKGCYGRGSELDPDTYQYFVRIMEAYREGFDSEEDKLVFVNNVFEQTENNEINLSCNQVGCRVVEMLLPFANDLFLKKFMDALSMDLRKLCSDRFASHVLEALVTETCKKSLPSSSSPEESKVYFQQFVIKVSKFLLNNLEDYIWDTYGNHVVRTCLENLVQLPKEEKTKVLKPANSEESLDIPNEYFEIVKEYGERIITWPQFNELCNNELTSCFLQVILKCLHKTDPKLLKKYLKKLLNDLFTTNTYENTENTVIPQAFLSKPILMLLETVIQIAPSKMYTQIYAMCFKGKLAKLAKTRSTNFAVQKLIQGCNEKVEFEAIFDELSDNFGDIVNASHTGVMFALAQTCKKLCAKQGSFMNNLMECLGCSEPEERQDKFILCLCRFHKYNDQQSNDNLQKEKLNLQGTLILQTLLDFNKPIKIVNGILNMDQGDLQKLFSNVMGSHIADSFVKGQFVGEKSREKLVRKMMGTYRELASSKYGSRSFEAIWNVAGLKAKMHIMEELSQKDGAWSNSDFGKIIAGKINLPLYKRSKEEWKNSQNKIGKTEKVLADILK